MVLSRDKSSNYRKRVVMGTRKAGEQEIRNLTTNSSGTYQLSIPKQLIAELKWRSGQRVTVTKMGDKLLVEDWKDE